MRLLAALLMLGCGTGLFVWGAEEGAPLVAETLKTAGIQLDVKNHEVRVEATVCLAQGILEYLVCLPNTFEHEAIFCVQSKPSVLHLSLLAVGLEPCPLDPLGLWREKAREQPRSRVRIEVEYEKDGKKQRSRISEFLVNRQQKDAVVPDECVFTGSYFGRRADKRVYAADVMGAVIGLGLDDASVMQFGDDLGNPYQGDEQGLEINTDKVPAKGTKVQLIFTPVQPKPQEGQESAGANGKDVR
jgi:hypothetical protein